MDQQKIGTFLKQLRQERQLTQENLAEIMCVTNRSVSRWENGVNLPDLPTLIQLADFYGVELRELLDGERKPDAMNTPETKSATEETARKVADYSNDVMEKVTHRFHYMYLISIATVLIYLVMNHFDFSGSPVLQGIQGACLGIGLGMLIVGGCLYQQARQRCPVFQSAPAELPEPQINHKKSGTLAAKVRVPDFVVLYRREYVGGC